MPDPLFDPEERIDPDNLPPELQGKSPAEIARYYMDRENKLVMAATKRINEAKQPTATPDPPTPAPKTSVTMTSPTEISFDKLPGSLQETAIQGAKQLALAGKMHLDKYLAEIETTMSAMSKERQADKGTWESVYFYVIGQHQLEIATAAVKAATTITTELSSPSNPTPVPSPLSREVVDKVLPGLGMSADTYRESQKRMEEGTWPITLNNTVAK